MKLSKIEKPTVFIDLEQCNKNVEKFLKKINNPDKFRPHLKTIQSGDLSVKTLKEHKITKITVSSVDMAEYYSNYGWDDITIAFPVNVLQIEQLNKLAQKIKLGVIVDNAQTAQFLAQKINNNLRLYIELDFGQKRSGVSTDDPNYMKIINNILEEIRINQQIKFMGFLNHSGHSYHFKDKQKKVEIYKEAAKILQDLKQQFIKKYPQIIISYGDTPTLSIIDELNEFDEYRPGNFVLYDYMQYELNSCELKEIAIVVACPIVGVYPERQELCIYGGGIHLAKDACCNENGEKSFGKPVIFNNNKFITYGQIEDKKGQDQLKNDKKQNKNNNDNNDTNGQVHCKSSEPWSEIMKGNVSSISQEHGVIKINSSQLFQDYDFKVGDIVGILPVHSCMTVDMYKVMYDFDGNGLTTIHHEQKYQN